ncbi:TonB-dependent receptor [Catenovulum adriaticum]|uniref:TonB-dependent receptor n=1 Tax=Catenovulum adriaticum TaxID=2984846 RepID=A0ABY7ASH3_9ALTE|nr:TonB-dependent receptor [Catenovulum sp. TS8]WAJ72479.1 TonB-dependent receptor [Catenovulum sp. TS8]
MGKRRFNKTQLAAQVSLLLSASMLLPAQAAENNEDIEVINVKGIRGSMIRAMDVKRDSFGVVDAISSEDIGKFPDTNLAESLQRITGISINRSDGEGAQVTIRGMGPSRNLVLLNGRQMPTPTRSFDFSDLASESVSAVEVYKTSKASIPTGGMGGTINIITPRPLANPGLNASFGVKAVNDQSTKKGDNWTPEISGIYSNTFADDTFGVAIIGSYQKRHSGNSNASVDSGWHTFISGQDMDENGNPLPGALPDIEPEGATLNKPTEGLIYGVPQNLVYQLNEAYRTRVNGQIVLEYKPSGDLTARLDFTHSSKKIDRELTDMSAWFSRDFSYSTLIWSDPDSNGVVYPMQYQDTDAYAQAKVGEVNGTGINSGRSYSGTKNTNNSIGLNLKYQVNDNLNIEFDYHDSEAKHEPNSAYGSWGTLALISQQRIRQTTDFTQEFPVMDFDYPDGIEGFEPEDMLAAGSNFGNNYEVSDVKQTQLKGKYYFDEGIVESIDFGLNQTKVANHSKYASATRNSWGGVGDPADFDDSWFSKENLASQFDKIPGHSDPDLTPHYIDWDFETLANFIAQNFSTDNTTEWPCGPRFCGGDNFTTDRITEEEMTSAYVQTNLLFDIGDMPANLVAGFRYEETDTFAQAKVPAYSGVRWASENEIALIPQEDDTGMAVSTYTEESGDYSNFLPSFDFAVEPMDDVKLRASYSKAISRPSYGDMQGGKTLGTQMTAVEGGGSRGNPALLPLQSDNYDLAVEWYYDEASYAAFGFFRKDVKNYIGTETVIENAFGLRNPGAGPRAQAARDTGLTSNLLIRQYIAENYTQGVSIDENGSITIVPIESGDLADPLADFRISVPTNSEQTATLYGYEMAVQHVFSDTGFGITANATIAKGDVDFNNAVLTPQFAIEGFGDSANLIGFYENDKMSLRIAYNWRDTFLTSTNANGRNNPRYTDAYGQIDVNFSYDLSEHLQVFVEGINITDEYTREHGRHERMLLNLRQMAPRYNIGARYTF